MAAGNDGYWIADLIWGFNGLILMILLLRLYTRIKYTTMYGADDWLNITAFVFFFVANVLLQIAVDLGYGSGHEAELLASKRAAMELARTCGQMLASITTVIAKAAVGVFLLRLAIEPWQRRLIWTTLVIFSLISLVLVIVGWVGCKPIARAWDNRVPGVCINTAPFQTLWGVGTILVDLIFCALPWQFIWKIHRPRREKVLIAGSLSLGIFAAGAGIMRVVAIKASVYALNVQAVLYTAIEISTTLVCTGIPACMPMYRSWFKSCLAPRKTSHDAENQWPHPIPDFTIGGTPIVLTNRPAPQKKRRHSSWWSSSFSFCKRTNATDETPLSRYEIADGSILRDEGQLLGGEKEIQATPSDPNFEPQRYVSERRTVP